MSSGDKGVQGLQYLNYFSYSLKFLLLNVSLFYLKQDKERALQLYNAMNGSSYDNPEDVEMVIHDGGISLSVRNDASSTYPSNTTLLITVPSSLPLI